MVLLEWSSIVPGVSLGSLRITPVSVPSVDAACVKSTYQSTYQLLRTYQPFRTDVCASHGGRSLEEHARCSRLRSRNMARAGHWNWLVFTMAWRYASSPARRFSKWALSNNDRTRRCVRNNGNTPRASSPPDKMEGTVVMIRVQEREEIRGRQR